MSRSLHGRFKDGGSFPFCCINCSGMEQAIASFEEAFPRVSVQHIRFDQFKSVVGLKFCCMRLHQLSLGWVVEVADRALDVVPVGEKVSDDVVADMPVDTRHKNRGPSSVCHGVGNRPSRITSSINLEMKGA